MLCEKKGGVIEIRLKAQGRCIRQEASSTYRKYRTPFFHVISFIFESEAPELWNEGESWDSDDGDENGISTSVRGTHRPT
jgi:hypothetical protein